MSFHRRVVANSAIAHSDEDPYQSLTFACRTIHNAGRPAQLSQRSDENSDMNDSALKVTNPAAKSASGERESFTDLMNAIMMSAPTPNKAQKTPNFQRCRI